MSARKTPGPHVATALVCLLFLAACGGSGTKTTSSAIPATETAAPDSPTATAVPATFGQIVWASTINPVSFAPDKKASSFTTSAPVIYAVVAVRGVTPGLTLSANWTYNGIPLDGVNATATSTESAANGWVEFHLTLAAGQSWPAGTYAISIRQPSGDSTSAKVTVKLASS